MTESDADQYKGPDPNIDGDLMDETWDPADDEWPSSSDFDDPSLPRRRVSVLQFVIAFLSILAFVSLALGNVINVFTLPSLDFLQRSRQLHQEEPLIQQLRDAVVHIHTAGRGFSYSSSQGTGFNIDPAGIIVTNRHVVEDAGLVAITFRDGQTLYARDWLLHPRADLAVIRLDSGDLPSLSMRSALPPVGTKVFIIGNPLGFVNTAMEGAVRAYTRMTGPNATPLRVMEIEAPIHPGNSGSPIFDQQGAVVGVVFAQVVSRQDAPLRGLAVPIHEVQELLSYDQDFTPNR